MGYLYKGDAVLKGNLSVATGKPLDERSVVQNSTELLTISASYAYNGMPVVSIDDAAIYILLDKENITSLDGWKKIGYVTIDGTNIDLSSYVSKEELEEGSKVAVALIGKVHVKIKGPIRLGEPVKINNIPGVGLPWSNNNIVVGKVLETVEEDGMHKVLCLIKPS